MTFAEFEASFAPAERGVHAVRSWYYNSQYLMCVVDSTGNCFNHLPFHDAESYEKAFAQLSAELEARESSKSLNQVPVRVRLLA